MNIELLRKVQHHIAEEHKRWCFDFIKLSAESPCGTQGCIGGWTVILGGGYTKIKLRKLLIAYECGEASLSPIACELLDITKAQGDRLFFFWPDEFDSTLAEDAVKRIDRFIETNGAE